MITLRDLLPLQTRSRPIVLAAGFFDGVHLGHYSVIKRALDSARHLGGEAWVLSFDTHPLKILRPETAPLMLTSTSHKVSLIEHSGVDGCILLPFTHQFAATSAEEFSQWLFHCAPSLKEIVVGENWRFGAKAAGTPQMLASLGVSMNIKVITMPPILHNGAPVSSTRIRQAVTCGNLTEAAAMLGRPPSVLGTVVHGKAIGRTLGYPSANIDPYNEALPPQGVYAVQARVGSTFYDGALNFGTRPTFERDKVVPPLLELHLLDFCGSLYEKDIEAYFIELLRDECYFATIEELKSQISLDVVNTRAILKEKGLSSEQKKNLLHSVHIAAH